MSQVPRNTAPLNQTTAGYAILDNPDITPLGQILRLLQEPEEVSAPLTLRHPQTRELSSVTIVELDKPVDHERERGAVFFRGTLDDGRRIEGFVHATPQGEDREVLGIATIHI